MKRLSFLFSLCAALLFSCNTYLRPGIIGNNVFYTPKPMAIDSVKSRISVNATYGGATSSIIGTVTYETGAIYISRGHTFKDFTFSYGAFGFLGSAYDQSHTSSTSSRRLKEFRESFSGIGIMTSFGLLSSTSNKEIDFRYINWENSISKEFGNYSKFRNSLYGNTNFDDLYVSNLTTVWTTGLSSEVVFNAGVKNNSNHAIKLFIGGAPNLRRSFDHHLRNNDSYDIDNIEFSKINFQFSYYLKINKFFGMVQSDLTSPSGSMSFGYTF